MQLHDAAQQGDLNAIRVLIEQEKHAVDEPSVVSEMWLYRTKTSTHMDYTDYHTEWRHSNDESCQIWAFTSCGVFDRARG